MTDHDKEQSFAKWTDNEIRDLAEVHRNASTVELDWTQPIDRVSHDVVRVPAWIEVCPWDGMPDENDGDAPASEPQSPEDTHHDRN